MKQAALILLLGVVAVRAEAQDLPLFRGHGLDPAERWRIDLELSSYHPTVFIDRNRTPIKFAGDLNFDRAELRLSGRLLRTVTAGVVVPYRSSFFESSELTASFRASGITGLGAFVDWRPTRRIGSIEPSFRVEYFHPGSGGDQPITINDDISTLAGSFDLVSTRPVYPSAGRVAMLGRVEFGPPHESLPRYVSTQLLVATGPRIASWRGRSIFLSTVGGYRVATAGRQEGNFFANRNAHAGVLGLMVSLTPPSSSRDCLTLSLTRDVSVKNGLLGWRMTTGVKTTF